MSRRVNAAAVIVGGLIGALAVSPAWAAPNTEVIEGRYVRLVSVADWEAAAHLQPGESMQWDIEISADAPEPGTMGIAMSADGGTRLVVDASLCLDPWRGDECPSGAHVLRTAWEVPRTGTQVTLREIDSDAVGHLRLNVGVADGPSRLATQLRVHVRGEGEQVTADPPDLTPTGGWSTEPWLLAGGGLLLLGTAALLTVRAWRRTDGGER